jgi:UDP-N-acetylglucosamine diphosphorylase / glucose-1-phosphate thymidylyltransferase / UDP-N-acetylgalactosamine diphosphorylase / glucosamine-1-phosphate N-acetyltransferase / galactosamine-1-phosphate N-acetyltransferase
MQAVILAAGKGSRLHPITLNRTKAMVPILGKPIVERVMETLIENGIRDFIMVISSEDGEVGRYFRQRAAPGISLEYVVQPERLGMANALSLAGPLIRDTFILSACDNLVPREHVAQLLAAHQARQAYATLSLMEIDPALAGRTGVVEFRDGYIRRIIEKPAPGEAPSNVGSLPLYVFSRKLLDCLPEVKISARGEYELQDAIQMLIDRTERVTGVFTGSRLQLTNAADLLALNRHDLTTGGDQPQLAPRTVGQHTHLITPLRIEEDVTIGPGCVIGPRVYIERDCKIGADVLIKDAVILRGITIEDGRQIVGEVVS